LIITAKAPLDLSIASPKIWLGNFLNKRNLTTPNSTPLYTYHLIQDEYLSLKQCVANRELKYQHNQLSKSWCAAFTLYCAEWFRREYTCAWSWQPIWDSLGFELSPSDVRSTVLLGLERYWQRPVIQFNNDNNNYLGSVFSEGGLPLKLLVENDNQFKQVFQRVLNLHDRAIALGKSLPELVLECVKPLPEAFQLETSVHLIAQMTEKLIANVNVFELDKQDDPATHLDRKNPKWRELFPLPLDAKEGADFLNGLLCSATVAVKRRVNKKDQLCASHLINLASDSLSSQVNLPASVVFSFAKSQVSTSRIELVIFEGEHPIATLGIFHAYFDGEQTKLMMRKKSLVIKRHHCDVGLYLVAMHTGQILDRKLIANSLLDIGQVPVGFIEDEQHWRYAGQASFSSKAVELLVILPPQSSVTSDDAHELLPTKYREFNLAKISGKAVINTLDGEQYAIKASALTSGNELLELVGRETLWDSKPNLVFYGLPSYQWQDHQQQLSNAPLAIYLGQKNVASLNTSELYGRHVVVLKNQNNQTLLRKSIGVLPKDFEIELVAGASAREGILRIKSQSNCVYQIINDNIIQKRHKGSGVDEIRFSVDGTPPEKITLSVLVNLLSEPILLTLPFPHRGAVAYDSQGKVIEREMALDDLLGSRIYLFAEIGRPAKYQLELALKDHCVSGGAFANYQSKYTVTDKPVTLSLYALKDNIEELMTLTASLDVAVVLTIKGCGRTLTLKIKKYKTMMDYDVGKNVVSLPSRSDALICNVKPMLMHIAQPERILFPLRSRESEGVATGEFELPTAIHDSGPWLVVPAKDSKVNFRAKFVVGNPPRLEPNEIVTSLQKAVAVYHPQHNPDVIAGVINQMANKPEHSGWSFLKSLYDNYGHLPLSTFVVWQALVNNSKALCLAVFRFESCPEFISRLESEFSVFWEFTPIEDWLSAQSKMRLWLAAAGLPQQYVDSQVDQLIDRLMIQIPAYSNTFTQCLKGENIAPPYPSIIIQEIINKSWYQSLLQQHADNYEWPNCYGSKLQAWFVEQKELSLDLVTFQSFQNGVVFLPLFAAAVATGKVASDDVIKHDIHSSFHLRQLRDFDSQWFESMYLYALTQYLTSNTNKDI